MGRLGTETAFETLAKARALERQGRNIVHLEIGEPDFDTPEHIRQAAKDALDRGFTHYGPSPGLLEAREAVARHQTQRQGYEVKADRIVITPGGKPIMFFAILALVDEGDEVIYPNPGFPIYESMINFVGGRAVPLQLNEESGFNADIDELRRKVTKRTKLIIVNSPNNPCGSVIPDSDLKKIAEIAVENDCYVMSDEIYKDFYYEGQHTSISRFPGMKERTIILDGFSKSYAMTGWRLGYGVLPEQLVEPVSRLMTNSVSCTASFAQMAGKVALEASQEPVHKMVAEFRKRREVVVNGLNAIPGIRCPVPKGAFYAFPNIRGTGLSSREFANEVLEKAGVALLSGTAFGQFGDGYIRISFANSVPNLEEAMRRIKEYLAKR
jgi:aspartate/methionine/tyrosine aminotransferase